MPAIARIGDIGSGHPGCGIPTKITEGSTDTVINGRGIARNGDALESHCDHSRYCAGGDSKFTVNSKPVIRVGDPVSCGGTIITGATDGNSNG